MGLSDVMQDLGRMGYRSTWGIFSASETGAPHQRKRVFIMAHRKCEGLEGWGRILQPESLGCRSSKYSSEGGNLLVNAINNDGRNVSREQCTQEKQSIISDSSNLAHTLCSGSRKDQQQTELRTIGVEQSSRSSWLSSEPPQGREVTIWPSRPGQPQYEWEPPRVVVNPKEPRLQGGGESHTQEWEEHSIHRTSVFGGTANPSNDGATECMGSMQKGTDVSYSISERPYISTDEQIMERERSDKLQIEQSRDSENLVNPAHASGGEPSGISEKESQCCSNGENGRKYKSSKQTQPSMGRSTHGTPRGMGYAELYVSCDNRTDELRLLGNGVVPATATLAFRTLLKELTTNPTK